MSELITFDISNVNLNADKPMAASNFQLDHIPARGRVPEWSKGWHSSCHMDFMRRLEPCRD